MILTAKTLSSVNLVSQLKLLPSLSELKGNDTIVVSTIIKKVQEMGRNISFLVSKVEKIVRYFYFHKPKVTKCQKVTASFLL